MATLRDTIGAVETSKGILHVQLSTWKSNGQIISNAQAVKLENGMVSFELFGDYNQSVIRENKPRITQKMMQAQHQKALNYTEQIIKECKEFYNKK